MFKKNFLLHFVFFVSSSAAVAAIIPTKTILQKTSESSGSGVYAIEQEVEFNNGEETLEIKESWLIANENTMKVFVTGGKGLPGAFRLQYLYVDGQKIGLSNGSKKSEKWPEELLERYFNFRSAEGFYNHLVQLSVIPAGTSYARSGKRLPPQFSYEPESWVRLSRTGGAVSYALGVPTPPEQESGNPGLWIEQDLFVVRKIRFKSQTEVSANNFNQFAKGLHYPRQRIIRWGNNTATIRLISASSRSNVAPNTFQTSSLEVSPKWDGISQLPAKDVITEFYSRFR